MFIFKSSWKEKGLCAVVASIGLASTSVWANGLVPTNISLKNNGSPINSRGGVFKSNVSVDSITLGEKTFNLNGNDFHSPIAIKLFAQSDMDAQRFDLVPDSKIGLPGSAFQFTLSEDVENVPGMTSLDVAQTSDLGRMLSPTGNRATRTQMFLPLPERGNNGKSPELILIGAVPNGTIKITPILAGTPDIQESLIFGRTLEIEPTTMASGTTSISMVSHGGSAPNRICVIGLDLAGDLRVDSGRMVVGYQLECPAGANTPLKMLSVGAQESGVYASDAPSMEVGKMAGEKQTYAPSFDVYAQAEAPAPLGGNLSGSIDAPGFADEEFAPDDRVYTQYLGPIYRLGQVGTPQAFPLPDYLGTGQGSSQSAFLGDVGSSTPHGPTPPVPAPGVVAILGAAAMAVSRRRKP